MSFGAIAAAAGKALATGVGGAVAGKLLGGGGGGGVQQVGTNTVSNEPPEYIAQQYELLADEIQNLQAAGQFGQFQQLTPEQIALAGQGYDLSQIGTIGGELAAPAAQKLVTGEMFDPARQVFGQFAQPQDYATGVGFQQALQSSLNPEIERITSQFARGGRGGSGAFAETFGRGISDAASPFVYQAQQAALDRQMNAGRGLAALAADQGRQMALGIEALPVASNIAFGDIERGMGYQDLLAQNQFMQDTRDVRAAQERAELIKAATFGSGNTTQPLYDRPEASFGQIAAAGAAPAFGEAIGAGLEGFGSSAYQGIKDYFTPDFTASGMFGS